LTRPVAPSQAIAAMKEGLARLRQLGDAAIDD